MTGPRSGDIARFLAKVHPEPTTGCWLWTAALDRKGYGRFNTRVNGDRRCLEAHRFAVAVLKGVPIEGLDVDHLCRTRSCVNPDHLEAVSHRENNRRSSSPTAVNSRKTHCPRGHKLVAAKGRRRCRTCATQQQRERRGRKQ